MATGQTSPMLQAALGYAEGRGWPVFPCNPSSDKARGSKAPLTPKASRPGARDGGHWLASAEERRIRDWWRRWPTALIGLPTGLRSGTVVVDLDPRDCPAEEMLKTLMLWADGFDQVDPETGEVFEPAVASTQSGGLHLYFAYPDEATLATIARGLERLGMPFDGKVGNRTNLFSGFLEADECPEELSHIDVRGEGGYVIAPPSIMENGAAYEWVFPPGDRLPPLPRRLRGIITGEFISHAERRARAKAAKQSAAYSGRAIDDVRVRRYVEKSIAGALALTRSAREGNRNASLFWAACRLGAFVRGGYLPRAEAEHLLHSNLPAGYAPTHHEVKATVKSGLDRPDGEVFSPDQLNKPR
jgi:putative DNA primase/helicase